MATCDLDEFVTGGGLTVQESGEVVTNEIDPNYGGSKTGNGWGCKLLQSWSRLSTDRSIRRMC